MYLIFLLVCRINCAHLIAIKFERLFDHYQIRFGLCIPPKYLNFRFYLDYLIHSRINLKLYPYVFTLSALDPRVYIFAYDFDLHSVLVHFKASLYKRIRLFFNIIIQHTGTTLHRILHKCIDIELCQSSREHLPKLNQTCLVIWLIIQYVFYKETMVYGLHCYVCMLHR